MRVFLFTLVSLIPLCSQAQFRRGFEPGYYILVDEPTVRHTGNMRIEPFYSTLVVKSESKTLKFKPDQVLACGNEKGKYLTVKDFKSGPAHIDADFAQQLDSGQVLVLLHTRGSSANGSISTYLVRRPTEATFTAIAFLFNRYREQVLPFIATRPDLVKLVQEKQVAFTDLQTLLHAFNTGQPYPQKR